VLAVNEDQAGLGWAPAAAATARNASVARSGTVRRRNLIGILLRLKSPWFSRGFKRRGCAWETSPAGPLSATFFHIQIFKFTGSIGRSILRNCALQFLI
jgi:hypothetical protein